MNKITFTKEHYNQMIVNNKDYSKKTFEELELEVQQGLEIVTKNKGFANLDAILDEERMMFVSAFINFRLAKEDLGEYVEEIDT